MICLHDAWVSLWVEIDKHKLIRIDFKVYGDVCHWIVDDVLYTNSDT